MTKGVNWLNLQDSIPIYKYLQTGYILYHIITLMFIIYVGWKFKNLLFLFFRQLRDEEARLDNEAYQKFKMAENAEAAAKQLEQEAERYR